MASLLRIVVGLLLLFFALPMAIPAVLLLNQELQLIPTDSMYHDFTFFNRPVSNHLACVISSLISLTLLTGSLYLLLPAVRRRDRPA